jgi:predicted Mrr-cat superfamily restriction endonuclease
MIPLSLLIKFFANPKNLIISVLTLALITLSSYNYYLSKRVDSLKITIEKTNTTLIAYKKEVKTLNDNMVTIAKVSTKIKKETLKKEVFTKIVAELPKITEKTSNGDNNEKYISAYNDLIDPWVQSSNNNSTSQTGPPSTSTTS